MRKTTKRSKLRLVIAPHWRGDYHLVRTVCDTNKQWVEYLRIGPLAEQEWRRVENWDEIPEDRQTLAAVR